MEKPGNWFAIAKIWKETSEEKKIKKTACIFTYDFTLGQFSVSAGANQAPGFSVHRASTPNGLFQTIIKLKRLMAYSKWLH